MTKEEATEFAVQNGAEDIAAVVDYLTGKFPKAICEYTGYDFNHSSEPYELPKLYQRDILKQRQIINEIAFRAKLVGITDYKSTLKAYMKENSSALMADTAPVGGYFTKFTDQPLVLECGERYICDDRGVQVISENGRYKTVCTHPIMPTEILKNLDTGAYKVRVAFRRGAQWLSDIFERSVLSQRSKIVEALSERGIAVNSENARELVLYFADIERLNLGKIPEKACISRLGWREYNGKQMFVPYTQERLVFDGEAVFRKRFESIRTSGDFDFKTAFVKWRDCISENIRRNCAAARVFFAASVASILVKPLGCNNFIVHIWAARERERQFLRCAPRRFGEIPPSVNIFPRSTQRRSALRKILAFCKICR